MVVQTNDLCFKTGCFCCLTSLYFKIPDCIAVEQSCSCCCCSNACRTGFPTSLCTVMGQACCFDMRCAFPCDPSNVPITLALCGIVCVDCERGGHAKYGNIGAAKIASTAANIGKYDTEAQLSFAMNGRDFVVVKDKSNQYCVLRKCTEKEAMLILNNGDLNFEMVMHPTTATVAASAPVAEAVVLK